MDENCGQVIWRVILPPGEDFWRLGGASGGVKIQHVNTGKFLSVTKWVKSLPSWKITALFSSNFLGSHRYPEPWGEGMREVVASNDAASFSLWTINFFQLPDMGQDTHHAKADIWFTFIFSGGATRPGSRGALQRRNIRSHDFNFSGCRKKDYPREIKKKQNWVSYWYIRPSNVK